MILPRMADAATRRFGFVFGPSRKELVDAWRYDAFVLGPKELLLRADKVIE